MATQAQKITPDYKLIYLDILDKKFPEKKRVCSSILKKTSLDFIDVMKLNKIIFGDRNDVINQKHRSYNKSDIFRILDYQKQNKLSNVQLATHFKMSKNTIAKWKKLFLN